MDWRDRFEMTVEPDSDGDVTITQPAGRECAVSGAICTKGGEPPAAERGDTAPRAAAPN